MLKRILVALILTYCFCHQACAKSISLDDMYREIVRADNHDYLPIYVKNRHSPDFMTLEEEVKIIKSPTFEERSEVEERRRLLKEKQAREKFLWESALNAVKTGDVTAENLSIIEAKAAENDPKAIEVLAWMYTKGVGVKKDFRSAYLYYIKAYELGVPNADKNADAIYKAMSKTTRQSISL